MSLSSLVNRVSYAGNGVTTSFAFPYYFRALTDFTVYSVDNVTQAITKLTYITNFTVTGTLDQNGVYSSGGQIVCVAAPATGKTLVIVRTPPPTQLSHWVDFDSDPATAKENAFDKAMLVLQRVLDQTSRAVGLKEGFVATFDPTLPEVLTANNALVVNATGDGFTTAPIGVSTGTVSSVGMTVPGIFSVAGSPITVSGTFAVSLVNQAANLVFAGPTNGAAATPAFRALVAADLPVFGGASSGSPGTVGAVVAPTTGQQALFLRGDATWAAPAAPAVFSGASSGSAGTTGLVVQPVAGQQNLFLRGDATWAAAGGGGSGGGGAGFTWRAISGTAPNQIEEFGEVPWTFQPAASGLQELYSTIVVPQAYVVGSPITVYFSGYSPSASNTILMQAQVTLITPGTTAQDSTTNQRTTTNAALTNSVAKQTRTFVLDVTDNTGHVNGVAVAPGDILKLRVFRGTDSDTADIRLLPSGNDVKYS